MVGGSIGVDLIGTSLASLQMVSATDVSANPAMHIISPALTASTGILSVPSYLNNFVSLPDSTLSPERLIALTLSFTFAEPCSTLPIKHLPRYLSESNNVANIAKGLSSSTSGAPTYSTIKSSISCRLSFLLARSDVHQPSLPDAYSMGKSS